MGIYRCITYPLKETVATIRTWKPRPSRFDRIRRLCLVTAAIPFFCPPFPTSLTGQILQTDTLSGDSISPIVLPTLEVRILASPLRLNRTPRPVSVLDARTARRGEPGIFLSQSLQGLPGLDVQNRYNLALGERISVRGQGARAQFGVRGLRVLLDRVPATLPDGQSTLDHLDLPSVGRIELLRGPSSALYGNGAGGVLRLETETPSSQPFRQELEISAGDFGLVRVGSSSSGTLGQTGYRVSAGFLDLQGYRKNPTRDGGRYGEARRKNLHGLMARPLGTGRLEATLNLLDLSAENPGSLNRDLLGQGLRSAHPFYVRQQTGKEITQAQAGLTWSGPAGDGEVSLTGWGIMREVWNPIPPAIIDLDRGAAGIRASLGGRRPAGPADLDWVVGLEGAVQEDRRRNFENEEGLAGARVLDQRETVQGTGAFVQGLLSFHSGGTLMGAVRYHRTAFQARDRFIGPSDPDDSGRRTMDAVSPSLGASLLLRESLTLRGSISSFFQTPTTTELVNRPSGAGGLNEQLEPEKGWNVEGGFFLRLPGKGHLELSVFQSRIRDELVPFQVPEAEGRFFYRNAGESRYRGVELAGSAELLENLSLRGAATLLDARFMDFAPHGQDFAGNRVPGAPRHILDTSLTWQGPLPFNRMNGFAEVRGRYRGSVPVDDANSDRAGPFFLLDLRFGFGPLNLSGMALSPFLGIDNVLDRTYVTAVSVNAFGGRYFDPGPPRSLVVGFRTVVGTGAEASPMRVGQLKENPYAPH